MNLATVSLSGRNLFYWKPFMKRGRNSPTELTTLSAVGLVIVYHHESKAEGGDWGFWGFSVHVVLCLPRCAGHLLDCSPPFNRFFSIIIIAVQLQLSAFILSPPRPQTNPASTLPLGFVHVSFTVVPENSSPCCPLPTLVIVRLFLTSMSLVIICLLFSFDYVPVKGEIIWYLSLTAWLISLSIMLSSSIHAIAKGISSFFLSAA